MMTCAHTRTCLGRGVPLSGQPMLAVVPQVRLLRFVGVVAGLAKQDLLGARQLAPHGPDPLPLIPGHQVPDRAVYPLPACKIMAASAEREGRRHTVNPSMDSRFKIQDAPPVGQSLSNWQSIHK
eukprot:SAG22_NODE_2145_length_2938_cov_1.732300_5_plen_124_part_00